MVEEMKIYLENLGPINQADISFGKITVVGGHNSTGKSSLSKFLFSFLKANSFSRQEIAYDSFLKHTKKLANLFSSHLRKNGIDDKEILSKFSSAKFNRRRLKGIFDLIDAWALMCDEFEEFNPCRNEDIDFYMDNMAETASIIRDNSDMLYRDLMNTLLSYEFEGGLNCTALISNDLDNVKGYLKNNNIDEFLNDKEKFKNDIFVSFNGCKHGTYRNYGAIILDDVFYIDSISILDVFSGSSYFDGSSSNHLRFLKDSLIGKSKNSVDMFDEQFNKDIINLESDINSIINGEFIYEKGEFSFISSKNVKSTIHNTASGVKQIGIIQLLLANRELRNNCVLMIDEPEVNLHPEWQMKFAEILVLISKKLNISIYINTHSPLFIEAIYTFCEYYDVPDETRYHLAMQSDEEGLFDINEVDRKDLSKIYDNLGKPYLAMDVLRLKKSLE